MANVKPPLLEILDDDDLDVDFLSQLEAAEAQALSLFSSSSKRRRVTLTSSPSPSPSATNSAAVKLKSERETENLDGEFEEGEYTAVLRGSKSLSWQKQSESQAPPPPRAVGGGACFKCGKEGHWARDCDQSLAVGAMEVVEKCCPCGLGGCLVLTANTERNRGRKFFKCPVRQENGGCGFFEWCDESSGNSTSAEDRAWKNGSQQQFYQRPAYQATSDFTKSRNEYDRGTNSLSSSYGASPKFEATENKGYAMKSSSSCFKCGMEGHWARDCQAPPSSNSSTPGSAGVKGKSSSADTCYKCGQSGHWAKDCSQSLTTKPRNW